MKTFFKHMKQYVKRSLVGVTLVVARDNRVVMVHRWAGIKPAPTKTANAREYKIIIRREMIEWSCIRDCFTEASNDEYYL